MNRILNKFARQAVLTGVMTFSVVASAAEQTPNPPAATDSQQRREPPPEAYQDCKGKQAGDIVQITTPREGPISATCTSSPKGLFARPERPPCDRNDSGKNQSK